MRESDIGADPVECGSGEDGIFNGEGIDMVTEREDLDPSGVKARSLARQVGGRLPRVCRRLRRTEAGGVAFADRLRRSSD